MEVEEGLEKIQDAIKICLRYISCYHDRKNSMTHYFKEKPILEWKFKSVMIFSQLDMFINQLRIVEVCS